MHRGGVRRSTQVINRPKAKAERIAIALIDLPPFCAGRTAPASARERSQHRTAGGREGELGPFQRAVPVANSI
jgi:hypothetical protein